MSSGCSISKMLIVNADDFGYSAAVNGAIVRAFDEGLVSSTTVIATMPGFEEACQLSHEHRLLAHVGAHLVLSEGAPLTKRIKDCDRFCDESGQFSARTTHVFRLSSLEAAALRHELEAQVARCRSHGLPLTHLDSHHHVHNEFAVGRIVSDVARREGIPFVRIARNCGEGIGVPQRVYKRYFNRRLDRSGLARTRYFGAAEDHADLRSRGAADSELADFEVMTHPLLTGDGALRDALTPDRSLADHLAQLGSPGPRVSFTGASYG